MGKPWDPANRAVGRVIAKPRSGPAPEERRNGIALQADALIETKQVPSAVACRAST